MTQLWFLQAGLGWQPNFFSFLVGLVLGIGLATVFYRALPRLLQLRDQSVGRVRQTRAWVRAGVEQRFLAETVEYVEQYVWGSQWANLSEIWVEPRVLAPRPELNPKQLDQLDATHLHYLWPDLAGRIGLPPVPTMTVRRLLLNGRRVLLPGRAGDGKTTLLAYSAYLCATASDTGSYTFLQGILPVLVDLAELDMTLEGTAEDVVLPLENALQQRSGTLTAPGIGALLRRKLSEGQVLLLIDGWDRCPGRDFPTSWLQQLLLDYPEIQVIVSGPPTGYSDLLPLEFTISGLVRWRVGQAEQFGKQWTEAQGWTKAPRLHDYWEPGRGPLFATLHLLLHELDLHRWNELFATLASQVLPEEASVQQAIQQIAHHLLAEQKYSFSPSDLQTVLSASPDNEDTQPTSNLTKAFDQTSLFIKWPNGNRSFRNPMWRDYFTALHLAENNLQKTVIENLSTPHWADTIKFYVGQKGENNLTSGLFDTRDSDPYRERLFQAATWLPETNEAGNWRRQVLIHLGQLSANPNVPSPLRQRAVAALAHTQEPGILKLLRQLVQRTDTHARQIAIAALPVLGVDMAVSQLEKLVSDTNALIRRAAIHALAWLGDPAAESPLLHALLSRDETTSKAVAISLALNGGEGWTILKEAIEDSGLHVRRATVNALALLDEYWSVQLLEQISLEDEEWVVKSAATSALDDIASRNQLTPWMPEQAGDQLWLINWAASQRQAVPGGTAAIPIILEMLTGAVQPELLTAAVLSLGYVQLPPEQVSEIKNALFEIWRRQRNQVGDGSFIAFTQITRAWG